MKRVLGLFTLVAVLTVPAMAFAGEQVGVYVAPKFIGAWTTMDSKTHWAEDADPGFSNNIGDITKGTFGGALALGYDFNRKFQIPVRTEIEYSAF